MPEEYATPPNGRRPLLPSFYGLVCFLQKHGRAALFASAVLLGLAAWNFSRIQLDNTITALLPESAGVFARSGELFPITPAARLLFIELNSRGADKPPQDEALREAGAAIRRELAEFLPPPALPVKPDPQALLNLLPAMTDAELLAKLETAVADIPTTIKNLRLRLSGLHSFGPVEFIRLDPLDFIGIMSYRLAAFGQASGGRGLYGEDGVLAPDKRALLLALQPNISMNDSAGSKKLLQQVDAALKKHLPGGITAVVAGSYRFTAINTVTIEKDLALTVTLSLVFIAVIYACSIRSWAALWLLLTPVAAVAVSGSLMHLIWGETSGIALGFGAAVLGLAEDYAVLVYFGLRKGNDPAQAVTLLIRPMFFSAILCIAGFCVLQLSDVPALRQLGFFAASSIAAGLCIAVFIIPVLPGIKRKTSVKENFSDCKTPNELTAEFAGLRPRKILLAALWLVLAFVCLASAGHLQFDTSASKLGAKSEELQSELAGLAKRWQHGAEPAIFVSSASRADDALRHSELLASRLRADFPLAVCFTPADILPSAARQAENLRRWEGFVAGRGAELAGSIRQAAAQAGFSAGAFDEFITWLQARPLPNTADSLAKAGMRPVLDNFLIEKNGEFHAITTVNSLGANLLAMGEYLSGLPPDTRAATTVISGLVVQESLKQTIAQEKYLLVITALLCIALLGVCFRKPTLIFLACLPPLLGLTAVLAAMALLGRNLSLPGAAALVLLIGLGADYGIVMLHELARNTYLGAYKSILVSGLTTLAGLGVLILAEHPVLHELGLVIFFGLSAELLAVLVLVPFILQNGGKSAYPA